MNERSRIQQLARASLTDEDCPSPHDLALYVMGDLTGTHQLRVAAHVRLCPLCMELIALTESDDRKKPPMLARLVPVMLATKLRSDPGRIHLRQFVAADVVIELRVTPPTAGRWAINGQVLRQGEGLPACTVRIHTPRRRARIQSTDPNGFFSFSSLPEGTYRVTVSHAQVQVEIRDLDLREDDEQR